MKIYVAICYDRHVNDEITVHTTLFSAINKCKEFMNYPKYLTRYGDWHRERGLEDDKRLYYIYFEFPESPTARVEVTELQEDIS